MVDRDLSYLAKRLDQIAVAVTKDVNQFVADVVLNVQYDVAKSTPVDEGVARSNWVVRVGTPTALMRRAYSPYFPRRKGGPGGTVSEGRNLAAAHAQGQAAIARRKPDQPVYITNNAPYIVALNQGFSRQAPAGFVQTGILTALRSTAASFRFTNTEKA